MDYSIFSNEELLRFLDKVLLEQEAYEKLKDGFYLLSNHPDLASFQSTLYSGQAMKYGKYFDLVSKIIQDLNSEKEKRRI